MKNLLRRGFTVPLLSTCAALFVGVFYKSCTLQPRLTPVTEKVTGKARTNSPLCFLAKRNIKVESLPSNTTKKQIGAVGIDMNRHGEILAYYPNQDFQTRLDGMTKKSDLADAVAKSNKSSDYDVISFKTIASPLDFSIAADSTTAFIVFPSTWTFRDQGFVLDATGSGQPSGTHSPFGIDPMLFPEGNPKVAIVDFDRNDISIPNEERIQSGLKCTYKYELPILITSRNGRYQTKVIIDPGIGNNGGPPSGP